MSLFSAGNDLIRAVSSQYEVDLILNSSFATRRLAFNKNRFGASANMQISLARRGPREGMPLQRWSSWSDGVMHLSRSSAIHYSRYFITRPNFTRAGTQASGLCAQRSITPLKVSLS